LHKFNNNLNHLHGHNDEIFHNLGIDDEEKADMFETSVINKTKIDGRIKA